MRALLARLGVAAGPNGTAVTRKGDRIGVATRVAAVAAAIGLVGVLVFGALWWFAGHGPAAKTAALREDALLAARQLAVNLQTLDYATVDKGLDTWQDSATGPLLAEFQKNRQQYAAKMNEVRTSSTARVVDVALADLDSADGAKARAIASVDVKTTQNINGTPSLPVTRQVRIVLDLVRVPDAGWKAAAASAIRP
jgi:Mce-associated membrane protein